MEAVLAGMRDPAAMKREGWYDSEAYLTLQREYRALLSHEREAACALGWPVWQPGQVFDYRAEDGRDMRGTCIRFDTEAGTVTGRTYDPEVPLAYLFSDTHVTRTVTVAQLLPYGYHYDKQQAEAKARKAAADDAAFRESHPLFGDVEVSA